MYDQAEDAELDLIRHYYPAAATYLPQPHLSGWLLSYNLTAAGRNAATERILHADLRLRLPRINFGGRSLRVNVFEWPPSEAAAVRLVDSKSLLPARWTASWTDFDVTESLLRLPNDVHSVSTNLVHQL